LILTPHGHAVYRCEVEWQNTITIAFISIKREEPMKRAHFYDQTADMPFSDPLQ